MRYERNGRPHLHLIENSIPNVLEYLQISILMTKTQGVIKKVHC